MALKAGNNRHITFDEDEDFENLPILEPLTKGSDEEVQEEIAEDSDSDAAPEEAAISILKEDAQKREDSVKSVTDKHKQQVKDKRKQQHEKNKLQQEEKRKRLEERRLPQALLEAFAAEQKTRLLQRKQRVPAKKKKRKIKTFTDSDGEEGDGSVQNIDEEGLITLDTGIKIRPLNEETKKSTDISKRAAEFRMNALYGKNTRRMPSSRLQEMKVKQMKSGKAVLGTLKT